MSKPPLMELINRMPCYHYWKRRPGKNPSHVNTKLKKRQIKDHMKGLYAIGLCPIRVGHSTTRVALFDLDNHSDDPVNVRSIMNQICLATEDYGLWPTCFTSSGGNGVHIYFVWDDDQDAYSVRETMHAILDDCLLIPGTGGLEKSQVEVFPKQNNVAEGDAGSMFILPYAFESEWLNGSWTASRSVPVLQREDIPESRDADEIDYELIESAVAALPNDDTDYDEWRNIVFAIHSATNGSAEGLALARSWSSKSSKHDDEFLTERVWPYVKQGKGITARTLVAKAHQAGWNDDLVDKFDTYDDDEKEPEPTTSDADDSGTKAVGDNGGYPDKGILPAFTRDNKGMIEATIVNIEAALRAAMSGGQLGFDDFTQQIMVKRAGEWVALRETANVAMRLKLERQGFKPIAKEAFRDVLLKVAEETTFDSARDWLYSLTWDGVPRLGDFMVRYFGAHDNAYHRAVGRYWWSALCGRICVPGIQADMVPVLVGDQGSGKSTALTRLVPQREQLVEIDLTARDADLSRVMQGALIGEIAELRGLNSREDEHIKAFITRTQEKWVPKYQEYPRLFDRRLLFVGTTNQQEFLSDHTGNRRWLPVAVGEIDRDALSADRDQLWAEGLSLYMAHGVLFKKAESLGKLAHSDFEIEDPWEVTVAKFLREVKVDFEPEYTDHRPQVTATNVLILSGLMPDISRINRGHHMRLGRVMKALDWEHVKFWDNNVKKQLRGYSPKIDELV